MVIHRTRVQRVNSPALGTGSELNWLIAIRVFRARYSGILSAKTFFKLIIFTFVPSVNRIHHSIGQWEASVWPRWPTRGRTVLCQHWSQCIIRGIMGISDSQQWQCLIPGSGDNTSVIRDHTINTWHEHFLGFHTNISTWLLTVGVSYPCAVCHDIQTLCRGCRW